MLSRSHPSVVPAAALELSQWAQRLAHVRHELAVPLAHASAIAVERHIWFDFGYRSQQDFARERLGRGARWLRKLAGLHDCMRRFPALAAAVAGADGGRPLGRSTALLLGRDASNDDIEKRIRIARLHRTSELASVLSKLNAESRASADSEPIDKSRIKHPPERDGAEDERTRDDTVCVRIDVPPEVRIAIDQVHRLHQAVSGRNAALASFAEAVVAEAASGGWSLPEYAPRPSAATEDVAPRAQHPGTRGARSPESDGAFPGPISRNENARPLVASLPVTRRAAKTLAAYEDAVQRMARMPARAQAGPPPTAPVEPGVGPSESAVRAEHTLRKLLTIEDELEMRIAEILLALGDQRAWASLGCKSLAEYARDALGMSRASAHRRVRLARGVRRLPRVREAYERGRISAQAVLWILQQRAEFDGAPSRRDEEAWLAHAEAITVKRLGDEERLTLRHAMFRRAARAHATGGERALPQTSGSFETAETSTDSLPREPSDHLVPTDAEWHASLLLRPGATRNEVHALGLAVLQRVTRRSALLSVRWQATLPAELGLQFLACANTASRSLGVWALAAAARPVAVDARMEPSQRIARTFVERCQPIPVWVGILALLEEYTRTWDDPAGMSRSASDSICHRDGARCMAPGCTARRNLQVHHAVYRSRGGSNEASNLVLLCAFHHLRGEHGGLARCRGQAPLDLVWRLGRQELATWFRNERRLDAAPA